MTYEQAQKKAKSSGGQVGWTSAKGWHVVGAQQAASVGTLGPTGGSTGPSNISYWTGMPTSGPNPFLNPFQSNPFQNPFQTQNNRFREALDQAMAGDSPLGAGALDGYGGGGSGGVTPAPLFGLVGQGDFEGSDMGGLGGMNSEFPYTQTPPEGYQWVWDPSNMQYVLSPYGMDPYQQAQMELARQQFEWEMQQAQMNQGMDPFQAQQLAMQQAQLDAQINYWNQQNQFNQDQLRQQAQLQREQ